MTISVTTFNKLPQWVRTMVRERITGTEKGVEVHIVEDKFGLTMLSDLLNSQDIPYENIPGTGRTNSP